MAEQGHPEVGDVLHCGRWKNDFKKLVMEFVNDGWFITAGKNVDGDYIIRLEGRPGDENGIA